mgnify:CR=1 FL=1
MATFTATRAAVTFPVTKPPASALGVAWGQLEVAVNPVAAVIYQLCRLPRGAVVVGGYLFGDDLDTNATETLDLDLGWAANGVEAADPDGFGNFGAQVTDTLAGIKPEAGIFFPIGNMAFIGGPLGMTFSAETIVQVTTVATAATFAAGTLGCVIYFYVP